MKRELYNILKEFQDYTTKEFDRRYDEWNCGSESERPETHDLDLTFENFVNWLSNKVGE